MGGPGVRGSGPPPWRVATEDQAPVGYRLASAGPYRLARVVEVDGLVGDERRAGTVLSGSSTAAIVVFAPSTISTMPAIIRRRAGLNSAPGLYRRMMLWISRISGWRGSTPT